MRRRGLRRGRGCVVQTYIAYKIKSTFYCVRHTRSAQAPLPHLSFLLHSLATLQHPSTVRDARLGATTVFDPPPPFSTLFDDLVFRSPSGHDLSSTRDDPLGSIPATSVMTCAHDL